MGIGAFAQTDTNAAQQSDTKAIKPSPIFRKPVKRKAVIDSTKSTRLADTLLVADSSAKKHSLPLGADTTHRLLADTAKTIVKPLIIKRPIDTFYRKLLDNPFLRSTAKPIFLVIKERERTSKDEMFYLIFGLMFFLAFIKIVFAKYFQNIFRLFFQPSFRQKQTREQLQQGNLPSLLLNLFFVFSAAAYVTLLLNYYHIANIGFWFLLLYSAGFLLVIYIGKFVFLSFTGWVFNVKEATDAYIFAIYLINKILGVVLLPFTLILAFSPPAIVNISITISFLLVLLLFLYRYLVSFGPVSKEVKVSPVHFFFYVLAFEITPLLLIYKTLMLYLNKSL